MKQHFVTFFSPGTFVAESTIQPIASWDTKLAIKMARKIKERHGATPYGFRFSTRSRTNQDLDSKVSKTSCMYFLGGKVETLEELEARNDPHEDILRSNMLCNNWNKIVINTNSWKWAQPLKEGDIVLEFKK